MANISRRRVLKASAGVSAALVARPGAGRAAADDLVRRDVGFDRGWKFLLGDPTDAHLADADDADWRALDLPHDWSFEDRPGAPKDAPSWTPPIARWNPTERAKPTVPFEIGKPVDLALVPPDRPGGPPQRIGPFDPKASAMGWGVGWTVGGVGWYRKRFLLSDLGPQEQVELRSFRCPSR